MPEASADSLRTKLTGPALFPSVVLENPELLSFFSTQTPNEVPLDGSSLAEIYNQHVYDESNCISDIIQVSPLLLAVSLSYIEHIQICLPIFINNWATARKKANKEMLEFYTEEALQMIEQTQECPAIMKLLLNYPQFTEIYNTKVVPTIAEEENEIEQTTICNPPSEKTALTEVIASEEELNAFFSASTPDENLASHLKISYLVDIVDQEGDPIGVKPVTPLYLAVYFGFKNHFSFCLNNFLSCWDRAFTNKKEGQLRMLSSQAKETTEILLYEPETHTLKQKLASSDRFQAILNTYSLKNVSGIAASSTTTTNTRPHTPPDKTFTFFDSSNQTNTLPHPLTEPRQHRPALTSYERMTPPPATVFILDNIDKISTAITSETNATPKNVG